MLTGNIAVFPMICWKDTSIEDGKLGDVELIESCSFLMSLCMQQVQISGDKNLCYVVWLPCLV